MSTDSQTSTLQTADYSIHDEALERLKVYGPESMQAGSSHAPMVVDALAALGRTDAVMPWIDGYEKRLEAGEPIGTPVAKGEWRESLGHTDRFPQWAGLFEREVREHTWTDVVEQWIPRLGPGISAQAFHGHIRTAHAVRALSDADTEPRRHELAQGLAYWAAGYHELPQRPAPQREKKPSELLHMLHESPTPEPPQNYFNIVHACIEGEMEPVVQEAYNVVDVSGDQSAFISDITEAFAHHFLGEDRGFLAAVAFLHCVTGPSDVRFLMPLLSDDVNQQLLRHCWHVCASLYKACGPVRSVEREAPVQRTTDELIDEVVGIAISTTDPHLVKFVEACLRENALNPTTAYLEAALLAVEVLKDRPT